MTHQAEARLSSLEQVIGRFARMARSVGRRYGLDPMELDEMLQDLRIRLWRARGSDERMASVPASYVYQAARSAALDHVRRRRWTARAEELSPGTPGTAVPSPDASLEAGEVSELVYRAVEELAEPRRLVVRLHLVGYESREIARMLGWTGAKTRNLLSRGLGDLRDRLKAAGVGPGGAT